MAKRHFTSDLKPNFELITKEIKSFLEKNNFYLNELYVVGSYANELIQIYNTTKQEDIDILVSNLKKTKGDVDLLVSYSHKDKKSLISKENFELALNEKNSHTNDFNKDYFIDLWVTTNLIIPKDNKIFKIFL